jgi:branched-subunit amino acid ABC-type transport system permease component
VLVVLVWTVMRMRSRRRRTTMTMRIMSQRPAEEPKSGFVLLAAALAAVGVVYVLVVLVWTVMGRRSRRRRTTMTMTFAGSLSVEPGVGQLLNHRNMAVVHLPGEHARKIKVACKISFYRVHIGELEVFLACNYELDMS